MDLNHPSFTLVQPQNFHQQSANFSEIGICGFPKCDILPKMFISNWFVDLWIMWIIVIYWRASDCFSFSFFFLGRGKGLMASLMCLLSQIFSDKVVFKDAHFIGIDFRFPLNYFLKFPHIQININFLSEKSIKKILNFFLFPLITGNFLYRKTAVNVSKINWNIKWNWKLNILLEH